MTTIISIKGKNERMGKLFKTPKYNLLYKGRPALEQTGEYMSQFGEVKVMTHENSPPDTGIVDMLLQMDLPDQFFVVDCDVIPIKLNKPEGTTVYCFENKLGLDCYSNFLPDENGFVFDCNEKEKTYKWAGAGVYYFESASEFKAYAKYMNYDKEAIVHCKSLAEVIQMLSINQIKVKADTTSKIFRFGSLQTILNNE